MHIEVDCNKAVVQFACAVAVPFAADRWWVRFVPAVQLVCQEEYRDSAEREDLYHHWDREVWHSQAHHGFTGCASQRWEQPRGRGSKQGDREDGHGRAEEAEFHGDLSCRGKEWSLEWQYAERAAEEPSHWWPGWSAQTTPFGLDEIGPVVRRCWLCGGRSQATANLAARILSLWANATWLEKHGEWVLWAPSARAKHVARCCKR